MEKMEAKNLVGRVSDVKPQMNDKLVNTQLYNLITQDLHGTKYSFNMLKILPDGSIETSQLSRSISRTDFQ